MLFVDAVITITTQKIAMISDPNDSDHVYKVVQGSYYDCFFKRNRFTQ